ETHLRRILRTYARYYNDIRTRWSRDKDAPAFRPIQVPESSAHTRSLVDCITTTFGFARHLRSKFPAMSRGALQQFERKAWNRLIDYLTKLPPLPSDD